jgi:hypothetical protein
MGDWRWFFDFSQRLRRAVLALFGHHEVRLAPVRVRTSRAGSRVLPRQLRRF